MPDYGADRAWSDEYLPAIKRIVGPLLLQEAPLEVDQQQATDLIVIHGRTAMIACRVRRPGYADRYPYEFTIRSFRDSGRQTEFEKIVNGWGDWLFYGHANPSQSGRLLRWMLINLGAFRAHLIRNSGLLRAGEKSNGDGTYFKYFDARSFPSEPALLIASYPHIPARSEAA